MNERFKHELKLLSSAIELLYDKTWSTEDLLFITNEAQTILSNSLRAKSKDIVSSPL